VSGGLKVIGIMMIKELDIGIYYLNIDNRSGRLIIDLYSHLNLKIKKKTIAFAMASLEDIFRKHKMIRESV
jgi:hypothetical protein